MGRSNRIVLYIIVVLVIAGSTLAYNFFVGFPKTFEGKRVRQVKVWSHESHFQPEIIYYAYTGPDGKDIKHGSFRRFDNGHLVQEATYRHGKVDGPIIYWNLFGEKTEEVYYRDGSPYGWAYFTHGKLLSMRQEVTEQGRTVAVKTFDHNRYTLQFNCGELIDATIDPASGLVSPVLNPTQHACAQP
jgi:hypothetical protein